MKKLLLVEVPEGHGVYTIVAENLSEVGNLRNCLFTELDPLTPEEINYFLTLHNNNPKGIIYSPIPPDAETKLRRML